MSTAYVLYTNFVGQFTMRISAKHLSKAWRATLQVGEVRIIVIRNARLPKLII